jgi:hypothetical protein
LSISLTPSAGEPYFTHLFSILQLKECFIIQMLEPFVAIRFGDLGALLEGTGLHCDLRVIQTLSTSQNKKVKFNKESRRASQLQKFHFSNTFLSKMMGVESDQLDGSEGIQTVAVDN